MAICITPLSTLPGELSLVLSGHGPELVPTFDPGTGRRPGGGRSPGRLLPAAPWMVLAAVRGVRLHLRNVVLVPGDLALVNLLVRMGVRIREEVETVSPGQSVGHLDLRGGELVGVDVPSVLVDGLTAEIPLLAVLAAFARGRTVLRGPGVVGDPGLFSLLCENLRALEIVLEEFPDGLAVTGPNRPGGAILQAAEDDGLTRALTLAGLLAAEACVLCEPGAMKDGFRRMFPENFRFEE